MHRFVIALLCTFAVPVFAQSPAPYHVAHTYTLATAPAARTMGWDPVSRRLFLVSARLNPPPGARRGSLVPGSFMLIVVERSTG